MLNKIFLRDPALEIALHTQKSLYSSKKDRRYFQQYLLNQAEFQYKKTARPYLRIDNGHVNYLGTLVDLIDRCEQAVEKNVLGEKSNLVEIMAITYIRPKLLFGKNAWKKENRKGAVKQFESEVIQLYHNWDSLTQVFILCQRYIDRGTTDLDRTTVNADFTSDSDAMGRLENQMNLVYKSYYCKLQAHGLRDLKNPTVDENLLHNCLGKPWLLPLAHIILVHDAQYKMKGKQKYKKEVLLNGNADSFELSTLSPEKQKACMQETYACAFEIRDALRSFFESKGENRFKTDCRAAFLYYFNNKKIKETPQDIPSNVFWTQLSERVEIEAKVSEVKSKFSSPPFSAPNGDINHIVLRIARKLHLSLEEVQALQRAIPDLLWGTAGVKALLENSDGFSTDIKEKLVPIFTTLRILVKPNEYFSANKTDEKISKNLLKQSAKLADYIGYSHYDTGDRSERSMEIAWFVYKYFLSFHDLTEPAMLLSKTVDAPYINKYLPDYLYQCKEYLHDNLRKYCSSKYVIKMTGVLNIDKAVHIRVSLDSKYAKLKQILLQHIFGIKQVDTFNWENAKDFLENFLIPYELSDKAESSNLWKRMFQELDQVKCEDYDDITKRVVSNLTEDEKKCLCFLIYSQLIGSSISCLEARMIGYFVRESMDVFRHHYSSKGGNSL